MFHPKETCQQYSKHGYCPDELNCGMRHPTRVCFEFQARQSCSKGDACRFRHPYDLNSYSSPFLGQRRSRPNNRFNYNQQQFSRGHLDAKQNNQYSRPDNSRFRKNYNQRRSYPNQIQGFPMNHQQSQWNQQEQLNNFPPQSFRGRF